MKRVWTAATLAIAIGLAACASTGSTFQSGVGDTYLDSAPWYAGAFVTPANDIAHLPIRFQGDREMAVADPASGPGSEMAALIAEMNVYLDARGASARINAENSQPGTAPDVQFGCETAGADECAGYEEHRRMRLAVGRPSPTWTQWAAAEAQRAGASRVLVITLEVGNYMPRQRDWKGSKEVRLGTMHTVDLPWLTSLDQPVNVLQLTGALMDANGHAIRIGAEGLLARRTNVALAGLGIQQLISDDDVQRVRTLRREDLPGAPLAWQLALDHMVEQLTGKTVIAAQ